MIGRPFRRRGAVRAFSGLVTAACTSLACLALPLGAQQAPKSVPTEWRPLGPALILDGAAWPGRVPVTGRINVVAPNPENPLGDVWIGSAGGGAWNGSVSPFVSWRPMTDGAPSLAVGDIQLDSCTGKRCATVWVGTGENGIRRDTQHGRGVLEGTWNAATGDYDWVLLGEETLAYGSVARLLLDPTTPDGPGKRLWVALSSGVTSNATHSTITTLPKGSLGIWRSADAGQSWENVLDLGTPATDLEMDPQQPEILFAGFRGEGLYRSTDGGDSWEPINDGIPPDLVETADWPELAIHRAPGDLAAILYAVLGKCPHPHTKAPDVPYCSPAIYRSDDSGKSWYEVQPAAASPAHGDPLTTYTSYTHALTIHPTDPEQIWYGGINLYHSADGGQSWQTVGASELAPHHHQVVIVPTEELPGGYAFYDVSDGGFFVGDGEAVWNGTFQHGLQVAQLQSVSGAGNLLLGGAQGTGTHLSLGADVWQHASDGGAASTLIDLDTPDIFYDTASGVAPRRCVAPGLCPFAWAGIAGDPSLYDALPQSQHTSWYPPFVQDPSSVLGQHLLYYAARDLFRNAVDGGDPAAAPGWAQMTPPGLGGLDSTPELGGIFNPITAVAVAPSNPNRLYLGYYDGKLFTCANALSTNPLWVPAASGLPPRPVSAIAVSPGDELVALAAFEGFGEHSFYRTGNAGFSWAPFDDALDPSLPHHPVHAVAIEPSSPPRVFIGTEDGVYTRLGLDPGIDLFGKTTGLPNVPVYDLELADGGDTLYAATHGRGVWMRASEPRASALLEDCCGYSSTWFPKPFVAVTGAGFDPGETCSMTLLDDAGVCATSGVDADGADLHTDSRGFLVASRFGDFANRPLAWACYEGSCIGGIPSTTCVPSKVVVQCGDRQVTASVEAPKEATNPLSTLLSFTPPSSSGGVLNVTAVLKQNGGLSQALCEVTADYGAGEPEAAVLGRVADAINASSDCGRNSLEAYLVGNSAAGIGEGEGPTPIRLALRIPALSGVQLVTEVRLTGHGTVGVSAFGDLRHGSAVVPRLTLAGTATGGKLVVRVTSSLGSYSLNVGTFAGDTAAMLSTSIFDGMTGRDTGGGLPIGGTGGPPKKPYAAVQAGAKVDLPHLLSLEVESADAGLTVTIGSGL